MIYLVIVYDPRAGGVVEETFFDTAADAESTYRLAELAHTRDENEVVLIGSTNRESLMVTHSHYFASHFASQIETPWSEVFAGID